MRPFSSVRMAPSLSTDFVSTVAGFEGEALGVEPYASSAVSLVLSEHPVRAAANRAAAQAVAVAVRFI